MQFATDALGQSGDLSSEDVYKLRVAYEHQAALGRKRDAQNKYEYDSDEDTDGGTWEHKVRQREMQSTRLWAEQLTRQAEGKHHIGDFLPPEQLSKYVPTNICIPE